MRLYKDPNSPNWFADLRSIGGGRVSTGTPDRKEAETRVYELMAKVGHPAKRNEPIGLGDLITRYLTYSESNKTPTSYNRDGVILGMFLDHCSDIPAAEIAPELIERFKAFRADSVKASSVNRDFNTIRAMFTKAVEWGYLRASPMISVKLMSATATTPPWFTEKEIALLLKTSPSEYRDVWKLFLYTGCRRGELFDLKWTDIKGGIMLIRKPKERKEKRIPVTEEIWLILAGLDRTTEYVLPRLHLHSVTHIFAKIVKKAGLKGNLHTLRHTTATHLLMKGVPIQVVQKILGHASISTTERYAHALESDKKEGLEKLKW